MSSFIERTIPTVRIATWNIDSRLERRLTRLIPIIETLRSFDVDVVCLQECWAGAEIEIAKALGMETIAFFEDKNGGGFGNAVISRFPVASKTLVAPVEHALLPGIGQNSKTTNLVSMTLVSPSGRLWRIGSTHLCWGGFGEGRRLMQAQEIESLAKQAESNFGSDLIQVLCGDFNARPESSTLRYFTGMDADAEGESTLWIDAWETRESAPGYTSTNDNPMVASIAQKMGVLDPSAPPNRRIDYILTRGWAYGKPGAPLSVKLLDRPHLGEYGSDHYGIVANLWDPAT